MLVCEEVGSGVVSKASVSRSQRTALLTIADKIAPKLRRDFINAFSQLRSKVRISQLADAISRGDERAVFEILGLGSDFVVAMAPITDHLTTGIHASGILTATQAAKGAAGVPIKAIFDLTNPRTARFVSSYNLNLIAGLNDEQRSVVRSVISRTMAEGVGSPMEGARALRRLMTRDQLAYSASGRIVEMFGLDQRRANALLNYRSMLENKSVAALSRDIGGNAARSVASAIRNDTMTGDKIERLVSSYASRLMQQRASAISHTEAVRAANVGSREAWNQVFEQNPRIPRGQAKRYWVATNDTHTRDAHRDIVELNADGVGMDEPFDVGDGRTIMYPGDPNADADLTINCRCTVVVRFNEVPEDIMPALAMGRSL